MIAAVAKPMVGVGAAILLFMLVFNQMAESPTFIIPVAGFVLWWMYYRRSTPLALPLFVLVAVLTTLSATDLFPSFVCDNVFDPYKLKVLPVILAWALIQGHLLLFPRWRERLESQEVGG